MDEVFALHRSNVTSSENFEDSQSFGEASMSAQVIRFIFPMEQYSLSYLVGRNVFGIGTSRIVKKKAYWIKY